ncbi:acyl-CoA thioesterase [Halegenticoccus soli]|uniref:acyl-CoA thioesterase n=1 Tax=Halegenticoccus soli TaxID=1985678 RepID=UPI000C6D9AC8|nr:thioesterase family protein [Halegenticoccus soli]
MSDYRYEASIQVRFGDLDLLGHVNNAVYVTYLEQARIDYFSDVLGLDLDDLGMVIARLEIDYRRSVTLEDELVVALRVSRLGGSSFDMEYELRAGEEVVATAETTQVTIDDSGSSRPIPEPWRRQLAEYEGIPAGFEG